MSSPSQAGPPPPGGNSSVLTIVLIVLAILAIACGGLCAGCVLMARKAGTALQKGLEEGLKSAQLAPAYIEAMQAASTNSQVIERLGEPITPAQTMVPFKRQGEGPLKPSGETLQFDIHGPKGNAIVSVVATGAAEQPFRAAKITVTFAADGSVIDIPAPEEKPESQPEAQRNPP